MRRLYDKQGRRQALDAGGIGGFNESQKRYVAVVIGE